MITYIEGALVEKTPAHAVIDCGGIGYFLNISLNTFSKLGDKGQCKLFTHLAIKEDSHTLYGFHDKAERELFRLLISVSGIGTSTARMILSSLTSEELQSAILNGDIATIKSVKGVGPKSAQRIIIDLKDKLGKEDIGAEISTVERNTTRDEALSALVMLGFNKNAAGKAIDKALKASGGGLSVEELVKLSLNNL